VEAIDFTDYLILYSLAIQKNKCETV